jgi:hypothetical protein
MSKILFYNLDIEEEERKETLEEKIREGWDYDLDDSVVGGITRRIEVPFFVIDPKKRKWPLTYCVWVLTKFKLEFGNQEQIGALKALEMFNIVYNFFDAEAQNINVEKFLRNGGRYKIDSPNYS